MMTPSVLTLSMSSFSRAFLSASRDVLSPQTTRTIPSTLAPRTSASLISSMGGRSKIMKSHSSVIILMNRVILSEPSSSAGFDDEHGLSRLGQGDGQVGRRDRLPFPGKGRSHGDRFDRTVGRRQEER